MSILKKSLISLSVVGLLSTSMVSISHAQTKTLVVGTNAEYPPFEFIHLGKKKGFDIDLATMIAKKLGMKVKFSHMPFASVIPSIKNGRSDMGMSAISATPARKKNLDFSMDYHTPGLVIVTKQSSPIKSLADIKNKKIAAGEGTIQKDFIDSLEKSKKYGSFTKKIYKGNPIMVTELKLGRIDAIITEDVVGYTNKAKNKGFKVIDIENSLIPKGMESGYAIAFKKGSPLKDKVNKVLAQLKKSGYIKQLENKWVKSALPK